MLKGFQEGHKINLGKRNALKHGNSPYKNYHIMQNNRIELLKKTKGKCELCGERGGNIHHLDNSSINHDLKNLILVCSKCHSFLHAKFDKDGRQINIKVNTKYIRKYGMTLKEIGKKFGVTKQAVSRWTRYPKKEAWLREQLGIK